MQHRFAVLGLIVVLATVVVRPIKGAVILPSLADNSSAPTDDPGWFNVGNRGVYLGNRWVLTVAHVGAGTTSFPGVGTYAAELGSVTPLVNPSGQDLSANTDLVLYRLATDPGLPAIAIAAATPAVGTSVVMIGDGRSSDQNLVQWDVTMNSPTDWTWTEVASNGDFAGYRSTTPAKRWGTNLVEETASVNSLLSEINTGFGDVISFSTQFNVVGGTSSEAQAQNGDSGGAVFSKDASGMWVLSGLIHAVSGFPGQPAADQTAIDGNMTYAADLSAYRSQIQAIVQVPEPGSHMTICGLLLSSVVVLRYRRV